MDSASACPLCLADDVEAFLTVDGCDYWRCSTCQLRYLEPGKRPTQTDEFAHYQNHENDVDDPGYRKFLNRLAAPFCEQLKPASRGLDYGCGPGPALTAMLREAGHHVSNFDPFFAPDTSVLNARYDFITCTEVAEHFHNPAIEFERLDAMLLSGGVLGLMTCFQTDDAQFANWHYRRDPTHVVFYQRDTLQWIADKYGWRIEFPCKDVGLMFKPV